MDIVLCYHDFSNVSTDGIRLKNKSRSVHFLIKTVDTSVFGLYLSKFLNLCASDIVGSRQSLTH